MRSLILLGLICFAVSSIASRDYRHEQFYRRYKGTKNKRGIADYPSYSYSAPSYSSMHSGIQMIPVGHSSQHFGGHGGALNLASVAYSNGGIGRGIQGLSTHGNSIDHSPGHNIPLHGISVALGGQEMKQMLHGIQASYPVSMANLGHDSIGLFTPAMKTGPVTFGLGHGGNRGTATIMPLFVTASQGTGSGTSVAQRYRLPVVLSAATTPASSHSVSGGYALALPSQSSASTYGHSTPLATTSETSGYSLPGSSVSYQSPSNHIGLSSGSSDSSSYQLPISSISYPVSSYSNSAYSKYAPASSSGSTYLTGGGGSTGKTSTLSASSYSYPSSSSGSSLSSYGTSGTTYGSSSSSHSSPSTSYTTLGSSHSSPSSSYATLGSSHTSPTASYGSISSSHSSPSTSYGSLSSSQSSSHSPYAAYSLGQSTSASYGTPTTSYSPPSTGYASFTTYRGHPSISYGSHSTYEGQTSSASSNSLNYHSQGSGSSYGSPSSLYSSASYSSPTLSSSYSSPSDSYTSSYEDTTGAGTQTEASGSYSNLAPQYLSYPAGKSFESLYADSANYDTISYSSPSGKY